MRKERKIFQDKVKLAYLAGFIDGEGCFTFARNYAVKYCEMYNIALKITNTNYDLLNFVKEIIISTGCRVNFCAHWKNPPNPTWKQQWMLGVTNQRDLLKLCNIISPYLVGKSKQCRIVIEYIQLRMGKKFRHYGNDEKNMVIKLRVLNQRGIKIA